MADGHFIFTHEGTLESVHHLAERTNTNSDSIREMLQFVLDAPYFQRADGQTVYVNETFAKGYSRACALARDEGLVPPKTYEEGDFQRRNKEVSFMSRVRTWLETQDLESPSTLESKKGYSRKGDRNRTFYPPRAFPKEPSIFDEQPEPAEVKVVATIAVGSAVHLNFPQDAEMVRVYLRHYKDKDTAKYRRELMKRQTIRDKPRCATCSGILEDDGHKTHVDHKIPVKELVALVCSGAMTLQEAFLEARDINNMQAVHKKCNHTKAGLLRECEEALT